jgi:hypothetical protein
MSSFVRLKMGLVLLVAVLCVAEAALYTRYGVDDALATCNDGSPYVFYMNAQAADAPWLLFFQGGAWCFDNASCLLRMQQTPQLMSSSSYPPQATFGAALDDQPGANPVFASWNKVVLPYCTSDDFCGARNASSASPWSFQGSRVLPAVVAALKQHHGLEDGGVVVLAGSSAGGEALYPNIDVLSEHLLPHASVFALDDSGVLSVEQSIQRTDQLHVALCLHRAGWYSARRDVLERAAERALRSWPPCRPRL